MILIGAGPLVALVDADDQYHAACVEALKQVHEPLGTLWPAITEAMYLLGDIPIAQEAVWKMLARNVIRILDLTSADIARIRELMRKYADLPMDLADAAIVRVAEREEIRTVFTFDKSDFAIYRLHGRSRFKILP